MGGVCKRLSRHVYHGCLCDSRDNWRKCGRLERGSWPSVMTSASSVLMKSALHSDVINIASVACCWYTST